MRLQPITWDNNVDIGEEDDIAFGLGKRELLPVNLGEVLAIVSRRYWQYLEIVIRLLCVEIPKTCFDCPFIAFV